MIGFDASGSLFARLTRVTLPPARPMVVTDGPILVDFLALVPIERSQLLSRSVRNVD